MLQKYNMDILELTLEYSEEIVYFAYRNVIRGTPKYYCQTQDFIYQNNNKETRSKFEGQRLNTLTMEWFV